MGYRHTLNSRVRFWFGSWSVLVPACRQSGCITSDHVTDRRLLKSLSVPFTACAVMINLASSAYLASDKQIDEPTLPRLRRAPARLEMASAPSECHNTPNDVYRQIVYEAGDLMINAVTGRFNETDKTYVQCSS